MDNLDVEQMSKSTLDSAIVLANKQINQTRDNPDKQKKYKNALTNLKMAKEKLDKCIAATKKIDEHGNLLPTTGTIPPSFYDKFLSGKESAVSLMWLSDKLTIEGASMSNLTAADATISTDSIDSFSTNYDIFDATRHACKDIANGGKTNKGLVTTLFGVGIAELAAKGVTGILAANGVMSESTGLLGLLKLGFENRAVIGGKIFEGMSAFWGFSPVLAVAAAGVVALKVVPILKRFGDKLKDKYKANHAFESGVDKLMGSQPDPDAMGTP